jgi:hypothetical protein
MSVDTPRSGAQDRYGRVRWRERQVLRFGDLAAEQHYRLIQRRRHDRGVHDWGIVTGLAIADGTDAFLIQPGVAMDGYGRSLVVGLPIVIPEATVKQCAQQRDADAVDVWLLYHHAPLQPPKNPPEACGPNRHSRSAEQPSVRLRAVDTVKTPVDPRRPPEVPPADVPFRPERIPHDDPDREWPVYLGRLVSEANSYRVSLERRPYAGLVGAVITSPRGDAHLSIGGERAGDQRLFAFAERQADAVPIDRLTIDHRGRTNVHGDTTLHGDLRLAATPNTASALDLRPLSAPPEAAAPWHVYGVDTSQEPLINQLRVEIGNPGDKGDPSRYRFAVGCFVKGSFSPCLAVTADCVVTVRGTLKPQQLVVRGPADADVSDPRLVSALLANWLNALAGAGTLLATFYSGALRVLIGGFPAGQVKPGTQLSYTVSVSNTGPVAITDVTVVEAFAVDRTPVGGGQLIGGPFTLMPVETWPPIARTFTVPSDAGGKKLSLRIAVAGQGPASYPVLAMAGASVDVVT